MEIKGLNAIGESFDENNVSIQTYIKNLKRSSLKRFNIPEKYYEKIEELYKKVFSSKCEKEKHISKGMLFHCTPVKDLKTGEVFYDKIKSIAKNGLLAVDMLIDDSDATDSTYLSFHSVLEGENSLQDIFNRLQTSDKTTAEFSSLIFFIDTHNPIIQELIEMGRHYGEDFNLPPLMDMLESKQTPNNQILKKMFQISNWYAPDNLNCPGVTYLPIGVPSEFISAIVVPKALQNDAKLIKILSQFKNAKILTEPLPTKVKK